MGQFVGEHGLEFGVVEGVDEAARDGDRIVLFADAAGEGVAGVGVDDAECRHGDAAADAEVLQKVPEPRVFASVRPAGRR